MRYIIETTQEGNDQSVWNTITSLKDKGLINVVEKGDPIEEMKLNLRQVARAVELLRDVGISKDLMVSYLYDKTTVSKRDIKTLLDAQDDFFRKLGVKLK